MTNISTDIPFDVQNAQAAATNAGKAYAESVAGSYSIGDELKKAVQNAYNYSQDVIGPFDTRTQEYLAGPATLRDKYSNPQGENYVANPFSREKVIAQGVGNLATPMLALASILGQRFGRYQDLIGAGTNAYQAQTARLQGNADTARQTAQDLLNNFQIKNALEQQARAEAFQREQFNYQKEQDKKKGAVGGSPFGDLTTLEVILNKDLNGDGKIGVNAVKATNGVDLSNFVEDTPDPVQVDFGKYFGSGDVLGATGVNQPTYNAPATQQPAYITNSKSFGDIFGTDQTRY